MRRFFDQGYLKSAPTDAIDDDIGHRGRRMVLNNIEIGATDHCAGTQTTTA